MCTFQSILLFLRKPELLATPIRVVRKIMLFVLIQLVPNQWAIAQQTQVEPKNVLLIVIDTLGAKHVGSSGSTARTTPHLDTLARKGTYFSQAFSTAPWTKASLASVFTSVYPSQHKTTALRSPFEPSQKTMAEVFADGGYKTAGYVSHTLIGPKTGYRKGFQSYDIVAFQGNIHDATTSNQVSDFGIKWLRENSGNKKQPTFLFLHYFDPHYNYQHHAAFDRTSWYQGPIKPGLGFRHLREMSGKLTPTDFKALQNLYEEEIAYTDQEIGRVLSYLEESGLSQNTVVVVTADHGEEFNEHGGIGHTRTLYNELVHIPLLIVAPGMAQASTYSDPVSAIDILPTISELALGKAVPEEVQGQSLASALRPNSAQLPPRPLFLEVDFRSEGVRAHKLGVVKGKYKLMLDKEAGSWELYDLQKDPGETNNLVGKESTPQTELQATLEDYRNHYGNHDAAQREAQKDQTKGKTSEEIEQLRTLGYL